LNPKSLDEEAKIASIDKYEMRKVLEETPKHYREALRLGLEADISSLKAETNRISRIIFLGMGGSAIGGKLIKDWGYGKFQFPVDICRDSVIPRYVNKETLTIAVSYSGNTQETVSAFRQALKRKSLIFTVSSGGIIEKESRAKGILHVKVPAGFQPRLALPYLMIPIAVVLERLKFFKGFINELKEALKILEKEGRAFQVSTPLTSNPAKKLALNLAETLPLIYGFREYSGVAYRFKTQLNENSKIFCKSGKFPELNHNEIMGFEQLQSFLQEKISMVIFRDKKEPADVKASIDAAKAVFSGKIRKIFELYGKGKTRLSKMLHLTYLGDYISFYLAILNQIDPTPIKSISSLKREVEKRIVKTSKI
jgi:glucose/mannose-6-phosphate isomerase